MPHRLLAALACACTAACAATPGDYPSLAVRDAERVSGTLAPPEPAAPEPLAPATLASVEQLFRDAAQANDSFQARLGPVRSRVLAARGAAMGSENWAMASVALTELETERSRTMVALADLDRLFVAAATEGGPREEIEAAQVRVSEMVAEQTARVDELLRVLD